MNLNSEVKRACVFCGSAPQEKNKEHILPQWLLRMTGDPSRVVHFGTHLETGKPITFSWSSFVAPACAACNNDFSDLEKKAQDLIERLLRYESLTVEGYIHLLDWLDKVRVGVWLAHYFIQKNPTFIKPSFYIEDRIAAKDRMLAIYPIPNQRKGLNIFGAETLIFQRQPSCFGLRINNILIVNMSSDFLVSARCGFPFPESMKLNLDGPGSAILETRRYKFNGSAKHPILRKPRLHKPSVLLYQPILQEPSAKIYRESSPQDLDLYLRTNESALKNSNFQ